MMIEVRFLAGRYHATPWGRHVNEAVAEWPPSPYRLVRAVLDAWYRKSPGLTRDEVQALLVRLAEQPPRVWLPPARASHTRSFLRQGGVKESDKSLVFDGFVVVDPREAVVFQWDEPLAAPLAPVCRELLRGVQYLGRSEAWVELCLRDDERTPRGTVCLPLGDDPQPRDTERVTVACALPRAAYLTSPVERTTGTGRTKRTHAVEWIDALAYGSGDVLDERLSQPPAMREVSYSRQRDALQAEVPRRASTPRSEVHGCLYAITGKVLPPVTQALELAEQARRRLMGISRRLAGGDPTAVSPVFSGKTDGRPSSGHAHAFFMPLDRDGDGRLDHMLVLASAPMLPAERRTLDLLSALHQRGGRPELAVTPIAVASCRRLTTETRMLRSETPFVPPHHRRRGRDDDEALWLERQVRLELARRGLPGPVRVDRMDRPATSAALRWLDFRRSRKGEQPRLGYGLRLTFAEPIAAPVCLGQHAHFGLGCFVPDNA